MKNRTQYSTEYQGAYVVSFANIGKDKSEIQGIDKYQAQFHSLGQAGCDEITK